MHTFPLMKVLTKIHIISLPQQSNVTVNPSRRSCPLKEWGYQVRPSLGNPIWLLTRCQLLSYFGPIRGHVFCWECTRTWEQIDQKETLVILIRKTPRRKGLGINRKCGRIKRVDVGQEDGGGCVSWKKKSSGWSAYLKRKVPPQCQGNAV